MEQIKQRPGVKALSMEGKAIRRNVLLDQMSLDFFRQYGHGNISLGMRLAAKSLAASATLGKLPIK